MTRAIFPRVRVWKRLSPAVILAVFATSCGSSSHTPSSSVPTKTVRGPGLTFSTPTAWRVLRAAGGVTAKSPDPGGALVSVVVSRLEKAYAPSAFAQAAKELDGVADKLAAQLGGRVTQRRTSTVDGMRIREYKLAIRNPQLHDVDDTVGFVLSGTREVQLLCQAPAGSGDPDGACTLLFGTLRLSS